MGHANAGVRVAVSMRVVGLMLLPRLRWVGALVCALSGGGGGLECLVGVYVGGDKTLGSV